MNNTKRSIGFSIAFMSVISVITFILPNVDFEIFGENISLIFPNILFFLFIILFSSVQYIFRLIITSKHFIKDKILFSLNIRADKTYSRLVSYLVSLTLFLWPLIRTKDLTEIETLSIVNLFLWILIIEMLLYISFKYTKIYFTTDGILVRGLDLRLDIPLNDSIKTHSGFYPYYDIKSYFIENNLLKLILHQDRGILKAHIPDNIVKQVASYLESKKINKASFHI